MTRKHLFLRLGDQGLRMGTVLAWDQRRLWDVLPR
eukprot:CAMPEP_0185743016 /NCGR_PEP_ID=MMETSP1174-20130828/573_1 /TAXON_ID=35687 /ORGANISM="Dictyocha speculum, Strain CCMP1381" /LENGTH=34 /DNA_ID= /DNA_START= /DNA_END= /DNA_ORIENTATION=